MTGIATKVKIGSAASAIALAAVLTPAAVANADPVAPVPLAGLGSSASASEDCEVGAPDCDLAFAPNGIASSGVIFGPPPNIFQNPIYWFGPANPNPPADTTNFFTFTPLPLIPGFLRPLWGFFTQRLNFQACIGGLSVKIGPYGSVSGSIGSSC